MQRSITARAGAAALAVALGSSTAFATILTWAQRSIAFTSNSTAEVPVPIKQNGSPIITFNTTGPALIRITYNAECLVSAVRGTWVSVKATVDGNAAIGNVGTDLAFCSAVDSNGGTFTSVSRQFLYQVAAAGQHTARIYARLSDPGDYALDDMVTVIDK